MSDKLADGVVGEIRDSLPEGFVRDVLETFVDPFLTKGETFKQLRKLKAARLKYTLKWFVNHSRPEKRACWPSNIYESVLTSGDWLGYVALLLLTPDSPSGGTPHRFMDLPPGDPSTDVPHVLIGRHMANEGWDHIISKLLDDYDASTVTSWWESRTNAYLDSLGLTTGRYLFGLFLPGFTCPSGGQCGIDNNGVYIPSSGVDMLRYVLKAINARSDILVDIGGVGFRGLVPRIAIRRPSLVRKSRETDGLDSLIPNGTWGGTALAHVSGPLTVIKFKHGVGVIDCGKTVFPLDATHPVYVTASGVLAELAVRTASSGQSFVIHGPSDIFSNGLWLDVEPNDKCTLIWKYDRVPGQDVDIIMEQGPASGKKSGDMDPPHDKEWYEGLARAYPATPPSRGPGGDEFTPSGKPYAETQWESLGKSTAKQILKEAPSPWNDYRAQSNSPPLPPVKQPCPPGRAPGYQLLFGPPVFYSGDKLQFLGGERISAEDATFWCVELKEFGGLANCVPERECIAGGAWRSPLGQSLLLKPKAVWRHSCRDLKPLYTRPAQMCVGRGPTGPTGPIECASGSFAGLEGCIGKRDGNQGWFNSTPAIDLVPASRDPMDAHDGEHR
ncbi:hypothetical protein CDD81_5218 [Ophiocordyceps australis]|uniref:Uncharacterized protein n=1 Tax=Ophiocordyceps australis TaxID=1399860 RepID=A0A2C5YGN1_9HYPO|nr:hypothetical protein CDD81_5218 [Ophiocordyceps australis]